MHKGRIDKIIAARGFMFLRSEVSGKSTFAHASQCVTPFEDLRLGDLVTYEVETNANDGRPEARGVTLVAEA